MSEQSVGIRSPRWRTGAARAHTTPLLLTTRQFEPQMKETLDNVRTH